MYQLVFAEDVVEEIIGLHSPSERRKLLAAVQCLPSDPSHPGIGEAVDTEGRANRISVIGGVGFTYWVDHTLRKIRVLAVQMVGE